MAAGEAQLSESAGAPPEQPRAAEGQGFAVSADDLAAMTHSADAAKLRDLGGVPGVCRLLHVDPHLGIASLAAETSSRQLHFGANVYPDKPAKTILFFIWEALQDFLVQVLFVCGIASLAISIPANGPQGAYDAVGIFIALFLIITVGAGSNYRQSQQFRALNREKQRIHIEVTREGCRVPILVDDLVVGDVVHLSTGDHVPTDGLVLEAHSLMLDESSLTGESDLAHKSAEHPFLRAGSNVMEGFGEMLVTAVGSRTEWGRVLAAIADDSEEATPLQGRLVKVAEFLGILGVSVAVAVFAILTTRYLVTSNAIHNFTADDGKVLLDYFTIAICILVIAVPEGLPLAVTLMLAFSVGRMMSDNALVRHLQSCETMGCTTTICSDKTGTLTLNQMSVTTVWVQGRECAVDQTPLEVAPSLLSLILEGLALNSSGSVDHPPKGHDQELTPHVSGSPTEKALLLWGLQLGLNFEECHASHEIVAVEPFSSERKRMGVLAVGRDPPGCAPRLHWKGAAEIVLGMCSRVVGADGNEQELDDATRKALLHSLEDMGSRSLRTLALAYRGATEAEVEGQRAAEDAVTPAPLPGGALVLLAVVGIKDPCRPEVPDAVAQCQGAGIFVRMVTGDSVETASAIARECGILTAGGTVMDGAQFRAMAPEEAPQIVERLQVLARASPTDKLRLVQMLKAAGEVVAATGDGTNDAPSLHEADVGLAMGRCGTEVAKESADIIILDDNFASIVRAVVWGRSVFSNIQRFLQFQLTVNVVALALVFFSACITGDSPFTAVQALWINLVMDTLGALALATELPSERALLSPPVGRSDRIVNAVMWRNVLGQVVYQLSILLTLYFEGKQILYLPGPPGAPTVISSAGTKPPAGDAELRSIFFSSFVFMQIFNQLNSRKLRSWNVFAGLHRNLLFVAIVLVEFGVQILLVELLGPISGCVPLTPAQWGICLGLGVGCVPFAMLLKFIPVPGQKHQRRYERWRDVIKGENMEFRRLEQDAS